MGETPQVNGAASVDNWDDWLEPEREIDWRRHVHKNPRILVGKPVVIGTRISVELILELLAGEWTEEAMIESHPRLTREDIRAALLFAVDSVRAQHPVAMPEHSHR